MKAGVNRELHIGISSLYLQPGRNGGMETYLRGVLAGLEEVQTRGAEHCRVTLFTSGCNHESFSALQHVERSLTHCDGRNRFHRILYEQFVLPRQARRLGCDVLFSPGYLGPICAPLPVLLCLPDTQYRDIPGQIPALQRWIYRCIIPRAIRTAGNVVTISEFSKNRIVQHEGVLPEKISVIYPGGKQFVGAMADSKSPLQEPYVLTVSSAAPHKNRRALLAAFLAARKQEGFPHVLVIIGGAATPEEAALSQNEAIRFQGYVPDNALAHWYAHATAFVLASKYEGAGLPVLEAMQAGVPVACAARASLPELAGEAALLFDPDDVAAMQQAIVTIITDTEVRAVLQTKGAVQCRKFSWTENARQLLDLLDRTAQQGKNPRNVLCSSVTGDAFQLMSRAIFRPGKKMLQINGLSSARYRILAGGNVLRRLWLRLLMYVWYPACVMWNLLRAKRGDIFVITSNTFFVSFIAVILAPLKGCKVVYVLYDLFPDALSVTAPERRHSGLFALIGRITARTFRKASAVVFLGEFLKSCAETRWGKAARAEIIATGEDAAAFTPRTEIASSPLRIHYGGLLGQMHDPETLVHCLQHIPKELRTRLQCSFAVSGAGKSLLQRIPPAPEILIQSPAADAEWRQILTGKDIGLVTLSPAGAGVSFPSKTYSYLAAGLAVLTICPLWSDLAGLILRHNLGWVINNSPYSSRAEILQGDAAARCAESRTAAEISHDLNQLLGEILRNPSDLVEKRRNAVEVAQTQYGLGYLRTAWNNLLQSLERKST